MKASTYPLQHGANRSISATADAALEFGHFRVLLHQRQLLADGVPVELARHARLRSPTGPAGGRRIPRIKKVLLSRAWPGIVVSEENLKVQISALRKALGADRDVIRTEFGRGYRFTAMLHTYTPAEPVNLAGKQGYGLAELGFRRTAGNRSGGEFELAEADGSVRPSVLSANSEPSSMSLKPVSARLKPSSLRPPSSTRYISASQAAFSASYYRPKM